MKSRQLSVVKMPSHAVGDACYGGILSIAISRTKHPLQSWKISEHPLVGIVIKTLPILLCLDNKMNPFVMHKNHV